MILTTHDMQDIEAIASRVILIGKGKKLMDGTLEELRREAAASGSGDGNGSGDGDAETDIDHIVAGLYSRWDLI